MYIMTYVCGEDRRSKNYNFQIEILSEGAFLILIYTKVFLLIKCDIRIVNDRVSALGPQKYSMYIKLHLQNSLTVVAVIITPKED